MYIDDIGADFTGKVSKGFSAYEQFKDTYFEGTILCYDNNTYLSHEDIDTIK